MRWFWLILLGSCALPTELRVHVELDDVLLTSPGVLVVSAFDDAGMTVYEQQQPTGPASDFPAMTTLRVVPRDGSQRVALQLRLSVSEGELVRDFTLAYRDGEVVDHDVFLSPTCLDVACNDGETCAGGECIAAGLCEGGPRMCTTGLQGCEGGVWSIRCE